MSRQRVDGIKRTYGVVMKKTIRKFISALLVVLVAVMCASLLFACNDDNDPEKDARERAESVSAVKSDILKAIDGKWSGSLTDTEIASLDNAGDYIVVEGWADMICEVFKASSLQTGKLKALKNAVASKDGQTLLADFDENAELLIPVMRAAGFTPTDISNLFYDLLCSLVKDSGKVIDGMSEKLNRVKTSSAIGITARNNINLCLQNLSKAKTEFVPNAERQQQMLSAFDKAKSPMSELVAFAYNMSIGTINDSIFDAVFGADGALTDITDSEINTIISTLLRNVSNLKSALGGENIANLDNAMKLVIDNFDKDGDLYPLYAQVVRYAKYAYMFVDVIPAVCDMVGSAGKIFDDTALIGQLREVAGATLNDNAETFNGAILISKILLKITEDFTADELCAIVDGIGVPTQSEYQKAMPLLALDVALNISSLFKIDGEGNVDDAFTAKHPDLIGNDDLQVMVGAIYLNMNFDNFRQVYSDYKNGKATFSQLQNAKNKCCFDNFGIENPYDEFNASVRDSWYNYYVNNGIEIANRKCAELSQKVVADVKLFIKEFYAENSASKPPVIEMAGWQLFAEELSNEDAEQYQTTIAESEIYGILMLLAVLTA